MDVRRRRSAGGALGDATLVGPLIIPYGSARVRPAVLAALAEGRFDDLSAPAAPVAVIDPADRRPLRMHAVEHPFTRPPVPQDLAHGAAQLAFLEAHLIGLAGDWAKPRRAFVAAYFAAVRATLRENRDALLDRLGPLAGLCELEHWGFSALMPLPAAHIPVPAPAAAGAGDPPPRHGSAEHERRSNGAPSLRAEGEAIQGPPVRSVPSWIATPSARDDGITQTRAEESIDRADFIDVDVAFWTGETLFAVTIAAGGTPRPTRLRQLARLEAAGVALVRLEMSALDDDGSTALLTTLGPPFANFWQSEPLPRSPFRGRGLDAPVPAG